MTTIKANDAVRDVLSGHKGLAEIRDSHGALVGYFVAPMPQEELRLYLKVLSEFDPVEHDRRKREESGRGRPLADILASFQASEPAACATP